MNVRAHDSSGEDRKSVSVTDLTERRKTDCGLGGAEPDRVSGLVTKR
jgi:hypothetical protein